MDFKLSYNWLKEFVDVRKSPEELAELLSLHSVSVERIHRLGGDLDRIIVGRVDGIHPHPNADRLRVVQVATSAKGTPAEVVCGGSNLRMGMLVAYAQVGARVRWHGQGDLATLAPAEIRGVASAGMICAASEIGLAEYFLAEGEKEILDCTFLDVKTVGQPLARALGMDDAVLEVEVTTNRPDLMAVEELAREVAAITHSSFRPERSGVEKSSSSRSGISRLRPAALEMTRMKVRVESSKDCPRYGAVVIDGVRVGPSPWEVRRKLIAAGL
ncbi:MAG: hypothetical protein Q8R16_04940, partial [bacterium]|nr:hypothetical protein [bacterium]